MDKQFRWGQKMTNFSFFGASCRVLNTDDVFCMFCSQKRNNEINVNLEETQNLSHFREGKREKDLGSSSQYSTKLNKTVLTPVNFFWLKQGTSWWYCNDQCRSSKVWWERNITKIYWHLFTNRQILHYCLKLLSNFPNSQIMATQKKHVFPSK